MNHFRAAERLPQIKSQDEIDAEGRLVTPEQMVAICAALGMAIIVAAILSVGVFFVMAGYAALFLTIQAALHWRDVWEWLVDFVAGGLR